MISNKRNALFLLLIFSSVNLYAQVVKRALFLGNSYTGTNNLPQLVADMATSAGKTLIFDSNTPGGYYLAQHLTNQTSLAQIATGNWDNVVLQDQSMALAYPSTYLNFIPYSIRLDSLIKAQNQCVQTMFYSTWGRKNGDTYLCTQPECATDTWINRTYYEMDSTIQAHYKVFADSAKASMAPVGAVWRYLRQNHPAIELFQADESHPTVEGSYAAACCFYTAIFRSDPTAITFNSTLSNAYAADIRNAVKQVVYNNLLQFNIGLYDHLLDSNCFTLSVNDENIDDHQWSVYPNPVTDVLTVKFPGTHGRTMISICNAMGVFIKEVELTQAANTIHFNEFATGLYIISIANSPHKFKVLKQ